MSRGYCKIIIVGNLGADPEMRYTPQGNAVTNFSVAVNLPRRDAASNQMVDDTTWYRVSVWGRQAEVADQYLRRDMKVLVEGELHPRPFTGNDGQERMSMDINFARFQMLGTREENDALRSGQGIQEGGGGQGYSNQQPSRRSNDDDYQFDDDDMDDVPF